MTVFDKRDLQGLFAAQEGPHVSIYLPTHRAGADQQQDPIRFKNLLRKAEEALQAAGLRRPDWEALLAHGEELLQDSHFWQHQADGLAVFLAQDVQHHYRLPLRFGELVEVSSRFNISPLLPLLMTGGQFYVLSLSQKQVRLYQGTRELAAELELEDAPDGLAAVMAYDRVQKHLQFHTSTSSASGGGRDAAFHGHGGEIDGFEDEALLRYLREIDAALLEAIDDDTHAPLVLAGVDELTTLYREVSTHPNLVAKTLSGNPDELRPDQIHDRAWKLVEPHFAAVKDKALGRYRQQAGQGEQVADRLVDVLDAAHHARVDELFVVWGAVEWGKFDSETNGLTLLEPDDPAAGDLINLAARQTLKHGGAVYAVEAADLPDGQSIVARLRY